MDSIPSLLRRSIVIRLHKLLENFNVILQDSCLVNYREQVESFLNCLLYALTFSIDLNGKWARDSEIVFLRIWLCLPLVHDLIEFFKSLSLLCHVISIDYFWLFSQGLFLLRFLMLTPWFLDFFKFHRELLLQTLHFELILDYIHVLLELLVHRSATFIFRLLIIFSNSVIWSEIAVIRWNWTFELARLRSFCSLKTIFLRFFMLFV